MILKLIMGIHVPCFIYEVKKHNLMYWKPPLLVINGISANEEYNDRINDKTIKRYWLMLQCGLG